MSATFAQINALMFPPHSLGHAWDARQIKIEFGLYEYSFVAS